MNSVQVAKNEDAFRDVNEQIRNLQEGFVVPAHTTFVCECSRDDCHASVEASLDEYRQVRADPRHFLVAPGHVDGEHERIIRSNTRFTVVEKFGLAGAIADATAP